MLPSEVIATPDRWTQGTDALDAVGSPVIASSEHACRWCAVGAVLASDSSIGFSKKMYAEMLVRKIGRESFGRMQGITLWNDEKGRTHAEVLAALKAVEAEMGLT